MTRHPVRSAACNDALQNRDRQTFGAWDDPGSASHRFALRRVRDTGQFFGRRSTIRFALPIERSIAPGGSVSIVAVTPISDFT